MKPPRIALLLSMLLILPGCGEPTDPADATLRTVERTSDQAMLGEIAVAAQPFVRDAAIAKLTDEPLLAQIALDYPDDRGRGAAGKLADQALLAKVAADAQSGEVRYIAMQKVTDQTLLAKVAVESQDPAIAQFVPRIADQASLATIASEASDPRIADAALQALTDQPLLATVAIKASDTGVGCAAAAKITEQELMARVAGEAANLQVGAAAGLPLIGKPACAMVTDHQPNGPTMSKFLEALAAVPQEHRQRLAAQILPAVQVLTHRHVMPQFGQLVSMKAEWESEVQNYGGYRWYLSGESFGLEIVLSKLPERVAGTWSSEFPEHTAEGVTRFVPASIDAADMLKPLWPALPQTVWASIAIEADDPKAGSAALAAVRDRALLEKVSAEAKTPHVRGAAEARLGG